MKTQWIHKLRLYWVIVLATLVFPVIAASLHDVNTVVSDSVITGQIKTSLATNEVTHALNISVETNHGVVTLSGTATSETEATKAIEIAESTAGVIRVDATQLTVKDSAQPLTDAYITAKVKGTYLRHNLSKNQPNVPLLDVKVETQDGVVYLSGTVDNTAQRNKLINLAKTVDGVKRVKSTVEIKN